MTSHNTPARIARIMALVIIGLALLAVGVSSVLVTFWVLLMAVPLLGTLWLVRNLLNGATQNTPDRISRIMALVIIGVALSAAGVSSVMTLRTSAFARFMYLEDLGLEETTAGASRTSHPSIAGSSFPAASWPFFGAAALSAAAVLARHRRRAGE